jgi:hypothetical protein
MEKIKYSKFRLCQIKIITSCRKVKKKELLTFTVFSLCTYFYCFVVILLFYVSFIFCSCFVVIVVLCIPIFVCTSVGLLPPGESPIAASSSSSSSSSNNNNNNNNNNNKAVAHYKRTEILCAVKTFTTQLRFRIQYLFFSFLDHLLSI